jgi:hypothetical protein
VKEYAKSIKDHYSRIDLEKNILAARESAGIDLQAFFVTKFLHLMNSTLVAVT